MIREPKNTKSSEEGQKRGNPPGYYLYGGSLQTLDQNLEDVRFQPQLDFVVGLLMRPLHQDPGVNRNSSRPPENDSMPRGPAFPRPEEAHLNSTTPPDGGPPSIGGDLYKLPLAALELALVSLCTLTFPCGVAYCTIRDWLLYRYRRSCRLFRRDTGRSEEMSRIKHLALFFPYIAFGCRPDSGGIICYAKWWKYYIPVSSGNMWVFPSLDPPAGANISSPGTIFFVLGLCCPITQILFYSWIDGNLVANVILILFGALCLVPGFLFVRHYWYPSPVMEGRDVGV